MGLGYGTCELGCPDLGRGHLRPELKIRLDSQTCPWVLLFNSPGRLAFSDMPIDPLVAANNHRTPLLRAKIAPRKANPRRYECHSDTVRPRPRARLSSSSFLLQPCRASSSSSG